MKGFTLIEILVVIGILTILMAAVLVAVNPFRQFAQANNANRWSGVTTILNAVSQRIVDGKGSFGTCPATATVTDCPTSGDTLPTIPTIMGSDTAAGQFDICDCIVDTYVAALPFDPQTGTYTDCTSYNTGYEISCDPTNGRVTVSAPSAQLGESISVTR
jgi:prepilin-type N-terminal cleavage/methylation domain-containing protein